MKKIVALLLLLALCLSSFAAAEESWICPGCGNECTGNFCNSCGTKNPYWTCPGCGHQCTGNFCNNCGAAKPTAGTPPSGRGDTVTLGTWGGKPIEWQVMEVKNDGTFVLMSVEAVDSKPYNEKENTVTWEKCSLRAWLNGEFYEKAFSAAEKEKILLSDVENPDNQRYKTSGGNRTQDHVFLLSIDEVVRYYNIENAYSDDMEPRRTADLLCMASDTALRNGASPADESVLKEYQPQVDYPLRLGACHWWLRSPAKTKGAAYVSRIGVLITNFTSNVTKANYCVRPVICVRF